MIAGNCIAPDVTVSSPLRELHFSPSLFSNQHDWIPERWSSDKPDFMNEERQNLKKFAMPFTTGTRASIGPNLAYMEISITMAALVLSFEWKTVDGPIEDNFGVV